jgi:hypothetical protein
MLRPLLAGIALAPVAAGACEISLPEVNQPMRVGADCSFELAGPLDLWNGDLAQDIGGGVVVQEQGQYACGPNEELVVTDCSTGEAVVIHGLPTADGWGRTLDPVFAPTGAVTIHRGMTLRELVGAVQRRGVEVSAWQSTIQAVQTIPNDLPDPYCGCRLFYPGSVGAGR